MGGDGIPSSDGIGRSNTRLWIVLGPLVVLLCLIPACILAVVVVMRYFAIGPNFYALHDGPLAQWAAIAFIAETVR